MAPKDLVKSMKTYARLLDNAIEHVDHVLARVPAEGTPSRALLLELEKAKAQLETKFERMDLNYDLQAVEVEDEVEDAHTKVYIDAKVKYNKALKALEDLLDPVIPDFLSAAIISSAS